MISDVSGVQFGERQRDVLDRVVDASSAAEMVKVMADARDRLEGAAYITGSDSGQPYGLMTRLDADTSVEASATPDGLDPRPFDPSVLTVDVLARVMHTPV